MRIFTNLKIASTNNEIRKILGAALSAILLTLLISFMASNWSSVCTFSIRHPGTLLVLMGVAGEGVEVIVKLSFKDWFEKHETLIDSLGCAFWLLVVAGLSFEIPEMAKSDKEAGEANERVVKIETTNAWLVTSNLALASQVEQAKISAANAAAQTAGQQCVRTVTALAWIRISSPVSLTKLDDGRWLSRIEFSNFETRSNRIGVKLSSKQVETRNGMNEDSAAEEPITEFWIPFDWDLTELDVIGVRGDVDKYTANDLWKEISCLKMKLRFLAPGTHIERGSIIIIINSLLDIRFPLPDQVLDEAHIVTCYRPHNVNFTARTFNPSEVLWENEKP